MALSTRLTGAIIPIPMVWIYASVFVGALLTIIQLILNFLIQVLSDLDRLKTDGLKTGM
jgi:TRAP-type C4-dicarboxylate transport system permease small subunit